LHPSLLFGCMCSMFRNKYRIEPCRLKGHDYSKGSSYFITICTLGKAIWFGNILNQRMILSESGQIAEKLWQEIPDHFSFVSLDEYVIMPDHVHGIIVINPCVVVSVETLHATSLHATSLHHHPQMD
jgi:putative transposase